MLKKNTITIRIKNNGDSKDDNVHPIHKQVVEKRMALIAENIAYGEKNSPAPAPIFDSYKVDGNTHLNHFQKWKFCTRNSKKCNWIYACQKQ